MPAAKHEIAQLLTDLDTS